MISVPLSFLDDNSFFGLDLDFLEVKQTPAPLPSLFSFLFTWYWREELTLSGLAPVDFPMS